jgi:ankyrin repeat protein
LRSLGPFPFFCGPIHDAAKAGDLVKVKVLLKENPELVSIKDSNGNTPLHLAAGVGHKDVPKWLLANKADANARDTYRDTPLHAAARIGNKEVAELLLANKGDRNAKTKKGMTPLHYAAQKGHQDVVELLRQHGGHE